MKDTEFAPKKKKLPYLAMAEALLLVGGVLILVGTCWFNWVSYSTGSEENTYVSYKGLDFGRKILPQYIEVYLIPIIGVIVVLASLFSAGRRRSPNPLPLKGGSTALRAIVLIAGMIAMILAFEIAYRYNSTMNGNIGLSFWDNARLGWYATLYGGLIVIIGAAMSFGKKLRKVGFIDYWLISSPPLEEHPVPYPPMMMTPAMHPVPQLYGPAMPPPPNLQPVASPGQMKPCPTCGKSLEYIPEYRALYCYACNRYP
jgi:hypothetical protein